ncbi:MAG: phenylalanine--tRNA ligase subunit beta [Bacteroidota bacterium]|nr:phenylalanine--tRNA ligase subunit beta [Bacteroidota bacterium]
MKISYNWLKQYIDTELQPLKVAQLLTDCGLEVESMELYQSVKGGLEGIVVGEVLTKEKHPDADKLSLTTVNIGSENPLNIVCGAPNVAAGQKVLVATLGTKLYSDDKEFEIKKSKIRGILSEGMICAEDELGLGTSHAGIMVLPSTAIPGTPAKEYFNLKDDYIFEIGITPNRADATSHIGVARDLAAVINSINFVNNKNSGQVKVNIPSIENFKPDNNSLKIPVIVEDTDACPRYSGISVSGVKIEQSPEWLKQRLLSIGQKPINNIVDITNFILHETGQPLHAFDADMISGKKVIVKKSVAGSKFTTLDNVERELTADDLMICNVNEPMCIAGVYGGVKSGITDSTVNIFLESAYFNPVTIRKTSKYHGLKTDASFRFERGTDPNITVYALIHAAQMMKEIAGGTISSDIVDCYPVPVKNFNVDLDLNRMDKLIGVSINRDHIRNILDSLDIKVSVQKNDTLKLSVPPYRVDVQREVDVCEDILRIYGYNNIPIPEQVKSSLNIVPKPDSHKIQNIISDYLTAKGFNEIMNNSITKSSYYQESKDFKSEESVSILNPLSKELETMRQTLLFGGLETIQYNINRKTENLKLYEFGKSYILNNKADKTSSVTEKYIETVHLSVWITGLVNSPSWNKPKQQTDFFCLKETIENILKKAGIGDYTINETTNNNIFDFAVEYKVFNESIGMIGKLNKHIQKPFDIEHPVFFADLLWEKLINLSDKNVIRYTELPKFPTVRRDLALLIDSNTKFSDIEKLAFDTERKLLKKVNLFDIYQGDKIESGKKSYAVSFYLVDENKTLTDNQIDKIMNKLISVFSEKLNAKIR